MTTNDVTIFTTLLAIWTGGMGYVLGRCWRKAVDEFGSGIIVFIVVWIIATAVLSAILWQALVTG